MTTTIKVKRQAARLWVVRLTNHSLAEPIEEFASMKLRDAFALLQKHLNRSKKEINS